ncbi:uncharacterized protein LOC141835572 [Curcuma longa]|uniref:uncharacterized protein LOC141835572 n=1 Tax=Curcuma longa TaxID=136217 RepID=UPI003D9E736E
MAMMWHQSHKEARHKSLRGLAESVVLDMTEVRARKANCQGTESSSQQTPPGQELDAMKQNCSLSHPQQRLNYPLPVCPFSAALFNYSKLSIIAVSCSLRQRNTSVVHRRKISRYEFEQLSVTYQHSKFLLYIKIERKEMLLEIEMEDERPLLPRLCMAVAIHLTSYIVCYLNVFRSKGTDESETENKSNLLRPTFSCRGLKDSLLALQDQRKEEPLAQIVHGTPSTIMKIDTTTITNHDIAQQCPKNPMEEEGLPLQEVVQEPEKRSPIKPDSIELKDKEKEAEIVCLSNLVRPFRERSRSLETEMLECYALKEQEGTIREFENRLRIALLETNRLTLKIKSLKEENQQLKLEASESSRTMRELESERTEVTQIKRKMESIRVQAREKIASLEKRINLLHDEVERKESREKTDALYQLNKSKELEEEAAELRLKNSILTKENLELGQRLDSAEISNSSDKLAKVFDELNQLREANQELQNMLEQLRTDHCADLEELVYLKWLNACLRYEQHHQTSLGRVEAKDLSNCLSPNSEEKAKQLILEYAFAGFDNIEYSSQETNEGDHEPTIDEPSTKQDIHARKSKLLGKLNKLVRKKGSKNSKVNRADGNPNKGTSGSTCSNDEPSKRFSFDNIAYCFTDEHSLANNLATAEPPATETREKKSSWFRAACRSPLFGAGQKRIGLDQEGRVARCKSDLGTFYNFRRKARNSMNDQIDPFRLEHDSVLINKYAEALLSSRSSLEI